MRGRKWRREMEKNKKKSYKKEEGRNKTKEETKGRRIEEKKNRTVVKWRNEKRSNTQRTTCNKEKEGRKDKDISLTHNNV